MSTSKMMDSLPGRIRFATMILGAILSSLAIGCGGPSPEPIAPVRGIVTIDGLPLRGGDVLFMPTTVGKASRGKIQPDGTFRMTTKNAFDGALIARHEVEVHNAEFSTSMPRADDQERRALLAKPRVVVVSRGENVIDLHY